MIGGAPRLKDIKHLQRLLNSDPCTCTARDILEA